MPASGIFEAKFKPADMSVEQLQAMSFPDRIRNFYSSRSSGDDEVDRIVYEKTLEEVSSGWAVGPIPLCDLPQQCVLSRRFGLRQPNKIRLIDDLSGSLINATVQTVESPKPHTTDVVASVVLELLKNCDSEVLGRAFDLNFAMCKFELVACQCGAYHVSLTSLTDLCCGDTLVPANSCSLRVIVQFDGSAHRDRRIYMTSIRACVRSKN